MTDTIKVENIRQSTLPEYGPDGLIYGRLLALMNEDERLDAANRLVASLPAGVVTFKLEMPGGVHPHSKYYGNVRFVKAYYIETDSYLGRMDLGYGDEVLEDQPEDFIASVVAA